MSAAMDRSRLEIIYAEDEFVFREITLPAFKKAGVPQQNVHVAEDGLQALEFLHSLQEKPEQPLIMLLDVRMPNMDGIQCAQKVQELVAARSLKRIPFMVCCSAAIAQVSFKDEHGVFQITLPKPFSNKEVEMVIGKVAEWFPQASPSAASSPSAAPAAPAAPAGTSADAAGGTPSSASDRNVDLLIADDEPICRMAILTLLGQMGMKKDMVHEAEDSDEMIEVAESILARKPDAPIVIMMGNPAWLPLIQEKWPNAGKSKLYIMCTSVDGDRVISSTAQHKSFNAVLPGNVKQADIKEAMDGFWKWLGAS